MQEMARRKASFRGNHAWEVKDETIYLHKLIKNENDWEYQTYTEEDFDVYDCPIAYLLKTKPVNQEWREKTLKGFNEIKEKRKKTIKLFKSLKEGESLQLTVGHPDYIPLTPKILIMEEIRHKEYLARAEENKRLYSVDFRFIEDISVIKY